MTDASQDRGDISQRRTPLARMSVVALWFDFSHQITPPIVGHFLQIYPILGEVLIYNIVVGVFAFVGGLLAMPGRDFIEIVKSKIQFIHWAIQELVAGWKCNQTNKGE